jgi:hypothetical protein
MAGAHALAITLMANSLEIFKCFSLLLGVAEAFGLPA